ncbi:MAG: hypothetical protein L3J22_05025 [Xanthomonadales bacterium]|nr:hypothetical protein [Xanthomonadales bacterium]
MKTSISSDEPIFGDIAVDPDGVLYGLTLSGEIRKINLLNGTTTLIN